ALGVYLPLIAVNCAIFGVAIINQENNHTLLQSVVYGFGAGVGFSVAILLLAGLRTKLEKADIPKIFKGYPITFIIAGLMSIAFMGFNGLF
ncbi:MAG: electron transport complex protein RnfA, partial [Lacrimispora sphenoides]